MKKIKNLRLIEIELFSYCNRKCNWCPNRETDRKKRNKEIEDKIFFKLLEDLKKAEYKNPITFSRYNEPLSHDKILKRRIFDIKKYLPENKLITNTNGDFLCSEVLDGLEIDELTVMDYDGLGMDGCEKRLKFAGAEIISKDYPYIYAKRNNMEILYFVDWKNNRLITDRGGSLKEFSENPRKKSCYEPHYFVGINYDGTVSPCCNIRNDIGEHKKYILGDLRELNLSQILNTEKATSFREDCECGIFLKNSPCYYCQNQGGRYTRGNGGIFYE
jgi:hypothetical protein